VAVEPVVEYPESASARWLHERRFRIALLIAFIESLLVVTSSLGWFWVVGAAILAGGLYLLGRRTTLPAVHEVTWILAVSQLISVIVPLLWEVVKVLAILVLVLLALFFLGILLLDRGRK
jgi:ABC-type anion transport system duplicated permease subunit